MLRLPLLLAVTLLALEGRAQETFVEVDLNAAEWEIANLNGSVSVSSVQLPIMALQALYEAGELSAGDPIYRYACCAHVLLSLPHFVQVVAQKYERKGRESNARQISFGGRCRRGLEF